MLGKWPEGCLSPEQEQDKGGRAEVAVPWTPEGSAQ